MQSLRAVWAWCNETTAHAFVALWVVGTLINLSIEVSMSKRWETWAAAHPRLAGVCLVLKALFGTFSGVARGFLSIVQVELQKRVANTTPEQSLFQQLVDEPAKPQPEPQPETKQVETPPKA